MTKALAAPDTLWRIRVYLLLLLALAVLAVGIAAAVTYMSLPSLGLSFGSGDRVAGMESEGPAERAGIRVGDRIITINGVSPLAGESYVDHGQEVVPVTVQREGQTLTLEIVPVAPIPGELVGPVAFLLTGLTFWIMAVVVLALKPHDAAAQMLVVGLLLAALGSPVLLLADVGPGWASMLMTAIILVLGPLVIHYHTVFPERIEHRWKGAMLAALYLGGAVLFLVFCWARLNQRLEWSTPVLSTAKGFFAVCLLVAFWLLSRTVRRSASRDTKRQGGLILLGLALGLFPLILFILLPQILPNLPYVTIWPALLALAFIPASYLYAIFRHDLMRLDQRVSQTVVGFLLFLALVAMYLAVYWFIWLLTPVLPATVAEPDVRVVVASVVLIVVLTASFRRLQHGIERIVHHLFYGGWYDYKSFVSRMTGEFSDALDMETIVKLLFEDVAGTMRLKAIALLLPSEEGADSLCLESEMGFDLPKSLCHEQFTSALLPRIEGPMEHRVLCERAESTPGDGQELTIWTEAGAQMWVPLVQQGELDGMLVLGGKQADEYLTGEDHDILATLSHHVTSAIARARHLRQLEEQVREIRGLSRKLLTLQDEILGEVAVELHAQAMPDIAGVMRTLEFAQRKFVPGDLEEARERLQEVLDYLRALMNDFDPPMLALPDLRAMLRDYAVSFTRKRDLPVIFNVDGDSVEVPKKVRKAVFRVFEEALNNAWQHAGAAKIETALDLQPHKVHLEIQDDGTGFVIGSTLGALANGGHTGLLGMRERIESVGGTWRVESRPGEGTRIVVDVPLAAQAGERVG
jgi:two-component system sensor histidine kinase ComP